MSLITDSWPMPRKLWISLALFCVTFACFSRVLMNDFVRLDDYQSVYENPHVQGLDWERLCWMFTNSDHAVRYKPLTWLSYALIYGINGLRPAGYHLANLLLHCFNAVLVFAVVHRLLRLVPGNGQTVERAAEADLPAGLAALLWAVNPLRVEAVARVTDLAYCLSLFFLLISLWLYLQDAQASGAGGRRPRYYWGSVGAFALSMLSYPFAFGYVVVLAALDWYPLRRLNLSGKWWREPAARRIALEKVPFLLLGGIVLATYFARLNLTGLWSGLPSAAHLNPLKQAIQACYVGAYFLWKPWLPFQLSAVYATLVSFNPRHWPFWSSAALVLAITLLVWRQRRQWPWALVLWLSYWAVLLSALGLTERGHVTFDRYSYMPGIVWAVIVAAVLSRARSLPKLHAWFVASALALAALLGGLSSHQLRIWQNSEVLFKHMLRHVGDSAVYNSLIHGYLGMTYADQRRSNEAVQEYELSLGFQPSAPGYYGLATLQESSGQTEAALTNYLKMLEFGSHPAVHTKVAAWLAERGDVRAAITHYRRALQASPQLVPALNNLAWLLATSLDDANRNGVEAVELAERACGLTQFQAPIMVGTLAAAYAEAGRFPEAIETAERAAAVAQVAGEAGVAQRNQQLLKLYRAGRPCRDGPAQKGPSP
jgi:hypothetical protein